MKNRLIIIYIAVITLLLSSCQKSLDIQPNDRIPAEQLFSDEVGLKMVLATLYNKCPIEDFNYEPARTINMTTSGTYTEGGHQLGAKTDEMVIYSTVGANTDVGPVQDGYWDYQSIRYLNGFLKTIKTLRGNVLSDDNYNRLWSEAHFIRAYMYFALAKRYGGVPLIKEELVVGGDNSQLYVPRSTEKATWDFILADCDSAIMYLPPTVTSQDGTYRASLWASYALKSRVALHAASIAKYWKKAPLIGEAVDKKLVGGMTETDANDYYSQCINASMYIIDNSGKSLYKPNPANPAEAAANFQAIFETPQVADIEVIFKKGYVDGVATGQQGHQMDFIGYPAQLQQANASFFGRMAVTLDLVERFEDYTDDGTGKPARLVTRTDGIEDSYLREASFIDVNLPYKYYDTQFEIFKGKDARLFASVILPGSVFKGVLINCQGGLIKTDGKPLLFSNGSAIGIDGKEYWAYGSSTALGFSAFGNMGSITNANSSSTGFIIKKFLQEKNTPTPSRIGGSTQDWIEFRLAEIYLNYAEAVVESGQGNAALAKTYLNAIRKRAAHTDQIPATIENILKERFLELSFEDKWYWDLLRRREMTVKFDGTEASKRKSFIPVLDLRQNPPKYFFVRTNNFYDEQSAGKVFQPRSYYISIPGVASNKLIQNPGY